MVSAYHCLSSILNKTLRRDVTGPSMSHATHFPWILYPLLLISSSSSSLFSQRIQVKLHISKTHWIHTGINGKESRKSNAYLAAYLGRTKKNTHKRTHDIWNIKNWKTFLHKHYCEHIVYMRTWIHTPCIITILFRCQPFKWRDISRDLVSFFFNNVAHSCRFFSQKVITVTADSQVTTGAKMSEGTVVAKSRT